MADGGFEAYFHVPQQSRRDKLRDFMAQNHHPLSPPPPQSRHLLHHLQGCSGLFYPDHPLLFFSTSAPNYYVPSTSTCDMMKPPGSSPMDGLGSMITAPPSSSSSSSPSPSYLDSSQVVVQVSPSYHVNPSSLPATSNNHFLYTPQNQGQGSSLSLSLSSHYNNSNSPYHQSQASALPLELDLRRYCGGPTVNYEEKTVTWCGDYVAANPNGSSSYEASRRSVPLGPFTGYASILRGSKFLKPAQSLLEQVLSDVCRREEQEDHMSTLDVSVMDPPNDHCLISGVVLDDDTYNGGRKSKLISMLEEVYKRYMQIYQQIQGVAASFEYVAGLGDATPFANFALKALSRHFKSVKIAITDQLQSANKTHGQFSQAREESVKVGRSDRNNPCGQKSANDSGFVEQRPVLRPQRGLPERAVAVLRTWLFDHFLHPYPTDTDKAMLANQTGLSRNQVSNWFINARVRLWKPMVEEIHQLESRQAPTDAARRPRQLVQASNPVAPNYSSARKQGIHDVPSSKCSTVKLPVPPVGDGDQLNYDMASQSHTRLVATSASGNGRVSLTLGLHQNNALASEPYPDAEARRIGLGLDANAQGFVMGNFESHHRRFDMDVASSVPNSADEHFAS